jgi:hypothetical protein
MSTTTQQPAQAQQAIVHAIDTSGANKVADFSYDDAAYAADQANGVASFNADADQNIPLASATDLNPTVLNQGFRTQGASIPRNAINHFWGRVSYNLNKIIDKFVAFLTTFQAAMAHNCNAYDPYAVYAALDTCYVVGGSPSFTRVMYINITGAPVSGHAPPDGAYWAEVTPSLATVASSLINAGKVAGTTPGAGGLLLLALSSLSASTPLMNGSAAHGSSNIPSRQDHVHPTDTSRLGATAQAADSAALQGNPASAFLGASAQAADSAMLGGALPSAYLGASAQAADSAALQGHPASDFLTPSDIVHGSVPCASSRTWTVPAGITVISITGTGAGGNGGHGGGGQNASGGGGGGGAGKGLVKFPQNVTPGETISVVIGGHGVASTITLPDEGVITLNPGADGSAGTSGGAGGGGAGGYYGGAAGGASGGTSGPGAAGDRAAQAWGNVGGAGASADGVHGAGGGGGGGASSIYGPGGAGGAGQNGGQGPGQPGSAAPSNGAGGGGGGGGNGIGGNNGGAGGYGGAAFVLIEW